MPTYRITGTKAAIDGLACLRSWQIALRGHDTVSACSASDGAVVRTAGNADWSGAATGYGVPPKLPGDSFTFTGSDRAGQGWQSSSGGALVSAVKIVAPIMSGRHIYYEMRFVAAGSLSKGAYAAVDATDPAPLNPRGLPFAIDITPVSGVEAWQLEINGNPTSPSYPSHLAGWPARDPGNIDATVSWQQTFDAMSQIPAINAIHQFQLYVTGTTHYDLKWCQVLEAPVAYPIEGDPPGQGEYVRMHAQAHFTGYQAGVKGWIKKPGGNAYWPAS